MKEIFDPQELYKIRYSIQNTAIIQDPNIMIALHRAYDIGVDGIYRVELSVNNQTPNNGLLLIGLLLIERNEFYPSLQAVMILTIQEMERQLDAFNAGYHWRYKGL